MGEDGAGDGTLFYVHVEGVGHDAAVRETRLAPHPGSLLQTVQHVRTVAVPALEREIDPERGRRDSPAVRIPSTAHSHSSSGSAMGWTRAYAVGATMKSGAPSSAANSATARR